MTWSYEFTPGDSIVEVTVTDELTAEDMAEIRTLVTGLITSDAITGSLGDLTAVTRMPSEGEMLMWAIKAEYPSTFKRAFVVPHTLDNSARGYETASYNRSQLVRLFTDVAEARDWVAN